MSLGECTVFVGKTTIFKKLKQVVISVVFRFQRLWDDEVARVGLEKASLPAVVIRFQKTRLIVSFLASVLFTFAVFIGPVCKMT